MLDILTEDEIAAGCYNDGFLVSDDKAKLIATMLKNKVKDGEVKTYEIARKRRIEEGPEKVPCNYCDGKGNAEDDNIMGIPCKDGKCFICKGTGMRDNNEKDYPFSEENVKDFAEFCEKSGGFEIW